MSRWAYLWCRLFGHNPHGPVTTPFRWVHAPFYLVAKHRLEMDTYQCLRCLRFIKFARRHPNGWIVVGEPE